MSRTFKDKKPTYGGPLKLIKTSEGKILSKHFRKYKRFGPPEPIDPMCPYCGNVPEYENGFLICPDCGCDDSGFGDMFNLNANKYAA